MGGRALQKYNVVTERKTTKEFEKIGKIIQDQIQRGLNVNTTIVKCYHTKKDHGDLDLLIKIDHEFYNRGVNLKKYISDTFKPNAIHTNGSVISFDYDNFQIDIIPIKESNWKIAQVYYSYDPLGNVMGKTFHKLNLSYGWDGLKYKYRNFNGRNSHDITISKNPRQIFEFGGYDYDRYLKGFDTIEEIFDFIINGKYFNGEMFKMENLKHIDKKRNRKRKSYHEFLKYVEERNKTNPIFYYQFDKNKKNYLPIINEYFPESNFLYKLKVLDELNEINKKINNKFNGKLIMEWIPELRGKELGNAITNFKKILGDNFKVFILNNSVEDIKQKFFNTYYGEEK